MDENTITPLTDTQIIDRLGGTVAVAALCNVKSPSVSEWRTKGIPSARRQFLQLLRPSAFDPKVIFDLRRGTAANEGDAAGTDSTQLKNAA